MQKHKASSLKHILFKILKKLTAIKNLFFNVITTGKKIVAINLCQLMHTALQRLIKYS